MDRGEKLESLEEKSGELFVVVFKKRCCPPLMSKDTETYPLNPKFSKFTFPRNSLILPRMVHIRIKVDLLPVRVSRDSQVTTDHPRVFPGWCTVQHSHTPVQVTRDSQDHPRLFLGWSIYSTTQPYPYPNIPGFPSNYRPSQVIPGMVYSTPQTSSIPGFPSKYRPPQVITGMVYSTPQTYPRPSIPGFPSNYRPSQVIPGMVCSPTQSYPRPSIRGFPSNYKPSQVIPGIVHTPPTTPNRKRSRLAFVGLYVMIIMCTKSINFNIHPPAIAIAGQILSY